MFSFQQHFCASSPSEKKIRNSTTHAQPVSRISKSFLSREVWKTTLICSSRKKQVDILRQRGKVLFHGKRINFDTIDKRLFPSIESWDAGNKQTRSKTFCLKPKMTSKAVGHTYTIFCHYMKCFSLTLVASNASCNKIVAFDSKRENHVKCIK